MLKSQVASGSTYHLQMYRAGQCRVKGRYAYRNYAKDRDHLYFIYVGVITGNGVTALIDTGMESVEEMNRGAGFLLSELISREPDEDTPSILQKAGITAEEVDYILLTHCHYDHCSMIPLFPNARVVVPAKAWQVWHEEPEGANYLHAGFLQYLESLHAAGCLILTDEGVILPGIGVRRVGGHSPCSQFIYVNTDKGVAVVTGDTVQMYGNVEQNDVIGIWVDDDECWQAVEIARQDPDIMVAGHDPRVLDMFPDGVIA